MAAVLEAKPAPSQTGYYPENDGQPMAENTKQFQWIVTIKENLDALLTDAFVAGDLFWYPLEGTTSSGRPRMCWWRLGVRRAIVAPIDSGKRTTSPRRWGMAMAVYPFLGAVAAAVGRLVRLQGTCATAHVQRRVREQLGERETVARAIRRTLRCFVDWGTLLEAGERGVYQAAPARLIPDKQLVVWLTEAALLASRVHTGVMTALAQAPALFSFHLAAFYAVDLAGHSRLESLCHGLNDQ